MTNREQPAWDCRDLWGENKSADIAETLASQASRGANTVNIRTMQGDVFNLGALPPEALAEFLAARRAKR